MSFIVGTDADGVLTDMTAFNIRDGKKYFKKDPVNPNAYHTSEMFGVSKRAEFIYGLRGALNRYCKYEPPRPDVVDVLKKMEDEGIEIHSITARKFTTSNNALGKYYRNLYEKWLKENKINFKSIQYCSEENSPRDKLLGCSKLKVDIMIEDKPDVALYLAENGVKVLLMDAPYNQNLEHSNITRVYNWKEIYNIIEELKIKKEENHKEFTKLSLEEKEKLTEDERIDYFKEYHHYLKNLKVNHDDIKKGKKRFKLIYNLAYIPTKIIFHPKVEGKENIPFQDGFIVASNHINSYDQYLISLALGNRYFSGFAASTIEDTFRGKLFKFMKGSVFIDRNDKESKKAGEEELSKKIVNDSNALIFPEGTRKNKTEEGKLKEQLPFKIGTVAIAQKTGSPILPVSIHYGKKGNYVKFGELMFINPNDNLEDVNHKLEETILNMTRKSKFEDEGLESTNLEFSDINIEENKSDNIQK